MTVFGKRIDIPGGNRRSQRERVVLAGSAVTLVGSSSIVVKDLCSTGAKLCGRNLPADGGAVLIKVGDLDVLASVAWRKGDECGITFSPSLDHASVEHLKKEGQLGRILGII